MERLVAGKLTLEGLKARSGEAGESKRKSSLAREKLLLGY
jgi:hypothetical protein